MAEINDLIFNDLEVENDFRSLLNFRFVEDDVLDLFDKEINFITMDADLSNKVDMPAVTLSIFQGESINEDDEQLQRYTPFTVEVEVYTSGDSRVLKNRELCNIIIKILQSNGALEHYYCRGLKLQDNREVGTMIDSTYRRVLRFSAICDNKQKLIYKGE